MNYSIRKSIALLIVVFCASGTFARDVKTVRYVGPFNISNPLMVDSVDASQKKYPNDYIFNLPMSVDIVKTGRIDSIGALNNDTTMRNGVMMVSFGFCVDAYTKVEVATSGPSKKKVYVMGKECSGKKDYQPGYYDVVVKYVCDTSRLSITVKADNDSALSLTQISDTEKIKRPFSMADNMQMAHYTGLNVSPSGKYACISTFWSDENGASQRENKVMEISSGRVLMKPSNAMQWMPSSDLLLRLRRRDGKTSLLAINPIDLSEKVLCAEMPSNSYVMSPTQDFVILINSVDGPKKEDGVFEVLTPDDRQPGWRNRSSLSMLDLKTGAVQPLTYGYRQLWLNDISQDGKYILFSVKEERLAKRPTSLTSVYRMNLRTMHCDTLIQKDGFIGSVEFIPNTEKLIIKGSPEALGGVGRNLPDDMTPNAYDGQLFVYDIPTGKVQAVTREFDPAVSKVQSVSRGGSIFFTAENADSVSLYCMDTKDFNIRRIEQPCELVQDFSLSADGSTLLYYGSSACVADRLYSIANKKGKPTLMDDVNAERMMNVSIGICKALSFKSERGYTLTGHYYLPANFDPSKKYPVIVHYYGGCTPTSRRFGCGSHYPAHYWNAMGYVVLISNPSGASGFGQEWAARHVNTMGEGVAQDIIETVEYFCAQNPWVDKKRIGCVSASYGGFMTQLLLTKTDLFAAGISHAGISDHTSYWGEGYWGYTYSQVSAADSYPWTRKDLYVDRSPLYNADKIHTPLLFTHGTADTNVPIGESIQMYTALKLLGVPTAFVMVDGENHGIMDFHKRQKWINTMVAWFDRWLKDDSSWWKAIYTPKDL